MTLATHSPELQSVRTEQTLPAIQDGRGVPHPFSRNERLGRMMWKLCQAVLVRVTPLPSSRIHCGILRMFGARIGTGVQLSRSVRIEFPWLLVIGDHCVIGPRARIYNLGHVQIGKHTVVSQDAHICAGTHDYQDSRMTLRRDAVSIGEGCWLCADSFVGPRVTVGDHAVVGARAVVTKDVPERAVVAGNPARIVKWRTFQRISSECEV